MTTTLNPQDLEIMLAAMNRGARRKMAKVDNEDCHLFLPQSTVAFILWSVFQRVDLGCYLLLRKAYGPVVETMGNHGMDIYAVEGAFGLRGLEGGENWHTIGMAALRPNDWAYDDTVKIVQKDHWLNWPGLRQPESAAALAQIVDEVAVFAEHWLLKQNTVEVPKSSLQRRI